jgi:hypothetical protein
MTCESPPDSRSITHDWKALSPEVDTAAFDVLDDAALAASLDTAVLDDAALGDVLDEPELVDAALDSVCRTGAAGMCAGSGGMRSR